MNALGMRVAFTLPLTLPLVIAIAMLHPTWFYPALMIVLGAHYLPFIFLYGMPQFGVLAALLIASGVVLGMYVPAPVSLWRVAHCRAASRVRVGRSSRCTVGGLHFRGQTTG